jgi:threonine aldolase
MKRERALISFASDNYSPVCPEAMKALIEANQGPAPSYGNDLYTKKATDLFKTEFDKNIEVFFVLNGTGANVTALCALLEPYESIICAETAHIVTQETAAIYTQTGSKIISVPSIDGKISPESIVEAVEREQFWGPHSTLPKVVSISQTTEYGTLYTLKQLQEISEVCKQYALYLHVDGCRLYNAAVALGCSLRALGREAGVDVLSLGGTKNGLMLAEAVVFFNRACAQDFAFIRKQRLQLVSKMRYVSAQYIPFLKDKVWKKNALHAHKMAQKLYLGLKQLPKVEFSQKVETNQLFIRLPKAVIKKLSKEFLFHIWNDPLGEIRLITSFNTTEKEVQAFVKQTQKYVET